MDLLFTLISAVTFAGGLLAVTRKNPIYAAAWMMVAMAGLAGVFVLLHSTFLGVIQVLLYTGAILVLFIFVIMLLNQSREELELENPPLSQRWAGAVFAVLLAALLGFGALGGDLGSAPSFPDRMAAAERHAEEGPPTIGLLETTAESPAAAAAEFGSTVYFGRTVYTRHVVAFELISLLILAAIAGVMVLAKRELDPSPGEPEEGEELS